MAYDHGLFIDPATGLFHPTYQAIQDNRASASASAAAAAANGGRFNVKLYGAKGDGTTDDTAAFTACANAMIAAGAGVFYMPSGTYRVTALPNFVPPVNSGPLPYAVRGDGSAATLIKHYGTSAGASLTVSNPLFDVNAASVGSPWWGGFTIDGANSSGGCSGLRWGDVSYGTLFDITCKNFTTGDGLTFPNGFGWTEGMGLNAIKVTGSLNQVRFDVGSGALIATVNASVASGATVTSLTVTATASALYSGQSFTVAASPSLPGVATQTFTTSGSVAVGATTIPVTSTTLGFALVAGTSQVSKGSYGSFDYWTVEQMYMSAQPNQNGIVSEAPRGLGGNIDRLGTTWRMTGNFFKGATNTGVLLWLKGNDNWANINWDLSCEVDGTGIGHRSVQHDTTQSYLGGYGKFIAYYFGAATGASYQFGVYGRVALNGYVDSSGSNIVAMTAPLARSVKNGVVPNSGSGGLAVYPTAVPTSGAAYQNNSGSDVFVTVTFTATAANASAAWNVDTWNGLPAGTNAFDGIPSGQTFSITFVHYHGSWAKINFLNCTALAPKVRFI